MLFGIMLLSVGILVYAVARPAISPDSRGKLCVLTWLLSGFYCWIMREGFFYGDAVFFLFPLLLLASCLYATYVTYRIRNSGEKSPR